MSADPILERMKTLHPKAIDMSLDRLVRLMHALGDPQDKLAPVVHVAGTNGKGSTLACLRAMLEADGKRVHVYTSPHLVRFNERIRLGSELISDEALADILAEIEAVNAGAPITFFEVTTAAAFLAFSRTSADYVLLETGMGGRLDATNIVKQPVAVGLTPISFDHMQFLGTTLAAIAGEKAGIVKPNVPTYVGVQPDAAKAVFERVAVARGAPLRRCGHEWNYRPTATGFALDIGDRRYELPHPALPGRHQIDNAALAAAIADGLGLGADAIAAGVANARWPARLQRLTQGPLATALGPTIGLYLDGGHNEAAGEVLAAWCGDTKIDLVFGMLSTKEPMDFLRHVAPSIRRLRAIKIDDEPLTRPASEIAEAARAVGILDVGEAASPAAAIASLQAEARSDVRVLICGSLYLCGRILADNS